jgi:aconitase A
MCRATYPGFRWFLRFIPLLVVVPAVALAQTGPYARDPKQPIDEEYTKKIKEYTTAPNFLSPLVDYLPASKTVPTPKAVIGDIAGARVLALLGDSVTTDHISTLPRIRPQANT